MVFLTGHNKILSDSKGDEDIKGTVGDHSSHYKTDGDEYDLRDSFIDDSAFQISSIPPDPLQSAGNVWYWCARRNFNFLLCI